MSVYCGYINVLALSQQASLYTIHVGPDPGLSNNTASSTSLVATEGSGSDAVDTGYVSAVDFQGTYNDVVIALQNISYITRRDCSTMRLNEFMSIKVSNLDNTPTQDVTASINIGIINSADAPEVFIDNDAYPRWSLSGIQLKGTRDYNQTTFRYYQIESGYAQENINMTNGDGVTIRYAHDFHPALFSLLVRLSV